MLDQLPKGKQEGKVGKLHLSHSGTPLELRRLTLRTSISLSTLLARTSLSRFPFLISFTATSSPNSE
jgi:hypothetical protein